MKTRTTTGLAAMAMVMACGGIAGAKVPKALDRVPGDAPLIITIDELEDFINDIDQINKMVPEPSPEMTMVLAMARGMPGLDRSGSAAVVMLALPEEQNEEPDMIVVLPISDFDELVTGGDAMGDGVVSFPIGDEELFARDLGGGFAAVGHEPELVAEYEGDAGQMRAHAARLGPNGKRLTKDAEITVIANIEALEPAMREGMAQAQQQAMMMAAMTGGQDVAAQMGVFNTLAESFINDAQVGLVGLSITDAGIALDFGSQFEQGSELAGYFSNGPGNASDILGRVPAMDYLFAFAGDYSGDGFKKLGGKLGELMEAMPQGSMGMPGSIDIAEMMENFDGQATVIGASAGMMAGGLYQNMVNYVASSDSAGLVESYREMFTEFDGFTQQGMKYATTFEEADKEIGGAETYSYTMQFLPDENAQGGMAMMDASQVMGMMFGPGGINGYMAAFDGGMVQTVSKNTELVEKALEAARNGGGLAGNDLIQQVAPHLPEKRSLEGYVSADQVLNAVGPMLMMFGVVENFEPADPMAPLGFGATTIDGGVVGRIFLPAETLASIMEMIPESEGGGGEMGGDEELDF